MKKTNVETRFKENGGITLIALVITIIVLLILAGISIRMISRNNSTIKKATEAKNLTEKAGIKEEIQIEALRSWGTDGNLNFAKLKTNLEKIGAAVEEDGEKLKVTLDGYTFTVDADGNVDEDTEGPKIAGATLGENYQDSWIGKTINYTSVNNNDEIQGAGGWIILGKQINAQGKKDVLITTANPVSSQSIERTLAEWTGYEEKIKNACKTYVGQTGKLGTKTASIKEVRSITLEDINNAVGFNETINTVTLGGTSNNFAYPKDDGTGWIVKGEQGSNYSEWAQHPAEAYYYHNDNGYKFGSVTNGLRDVPITLGKPDNMAYILANNRPYWVASRSVNVDSEGADFGVAYVYLGYVDGSHSDLCNSDASGGYDLGGYASCGSYKVALGFKIVGIAPIIKPKDYGLRPVLVLSSEIPWSNAEGTIGDYAKYDGSSSSGGG